MNHVREKGKPRCKLLYQIFEEQDGYDPLLDIFSFSALIQLTYSLGGIQHCVTVVDKWIFNGNINFALHINFDNLDY